jgi:hypothetical protein
MIAAIGSTPRTAVPLRAELRQPLRRLAHVQDHGVAAEVLDERRALGRLQLPALGEPLRVAEHQLGVFEGRVRSNLQDAVAFLCGERNRLAADQPLVADRHDPCDEEAAGREVVEDRGSDVGADPVLEVVDEVDRHESLAGASGHFERALEDLAPAHEELPLGRGQVGPGLEKTVDDRLAVAAAVLLDEPVEEVVDLCVALVRVDAPELDRALERPLEPRALGERERLPLERAAAVHQLVDRRHRAPLVPWCGRA